MERLGVWEAALQLRQLEVAAAKLSAQQCLTTTRITNAQELRVERKRVADLEEEMARR